MRIRRTLGLCFLLVAIVPALAAAQDTRKVGITMGYPAAFGVLWHASSSLAIRPELSVSGSSNETLSNSFESEGDGWAVGTGISALFYLGPADKLRTYVSPRYTYAHTSNTTELASVTNSSTTATTNINSVAGSFGAQYAVGDRFSVYGEVGFGFSHSTAKSSPSGIKGSGNSWGLRSGVGVVFYP
jgi:Outer membrane protein beta-barrel domain